MLLCTGHLVWARGSVCNQTFKWGTSIFPPCLLSPFFPCFPEELLAAATMSSQCSLPPAPPRPHPCRMLTRMWSCRYHPAMAAVSAVRRCLRVRTAFNLLGPLLNPARAGYGLIGVYSPDVAPLM